MRDVYYIMHLKGKVRKAKNDLKEPDKILRWLGKKACIDGEYLAIFWFLDVSMYVLIYLG